MMSKIAQIKKDNQGFTLVELMIVVAIIGILAAIAIPQFAAYRIRGFNSSAVSDVKNIATSQAAFYADWQGYGISDDAADLAAAITAAAARVAAGTAIAGGLITGGDGVATSDFISGEDNSGTGRANNIALGNGVSIVSNSSGPFDSFTAVAKHIQGDTMYGLDSDVTTLYQDPTSIAAGTALSISATNTPPSVITADDFDTIGDYVVK